jgi:hypothetical protein
MKDNQQHSFEEQWRNAFEDASMSPPDSVWGGIKAQLGDTAPLPPSGSGLPFYYIGSLAGIVALGIGAYFFFEGKSTPIPVQRTAQVIEQKLEKVPEMKPVEKELILVKKDLKPTISKQKENPVLVTIPVVEIAENNQEKEIQSSDNQMVESKKELSENIKPLASKPVKNYETSPIVPPEIQAKDTTAYYVKAKPQPKKETIWEKVKKNVKVSGGVGVYQ